MSLRYEKVQTKIGFGTEKEDKYVGRRRLADPFSLQRLAKEVSHITGQQQAQVEITLTYMVQAIEDAIQDGRSVDIGIGTVSPAISTKAADTADDVKVVRKRVLFRASKRLRQIVQDMNIRLITDTDTDDDADDGGGTSASGTGTGTGSGSSSGGSGSHDVDDGEGNG